MTGMIEIEGSHGEGGGQILRTSLALSLVTGKPFWITNIRSKRKKPGLLQQHLTAVNAAVEIGQAEVIGNDLGSQELHFAPRTVKPGKYRFNVGTAGSCMLVLQTILPPLMIAEDKSKLILEGGTHNPFAPPFEFMDKAFLPILNKMGPKVRANLKRPGFYPNGGGRVDVSIKPSALLSKIDLVERGNVRNRMAWAIVAHLPQKIGKRELKIVQDRLGWNGTYLKLKEEENSLGPGNILLIEIQFDRITEIFTGFGMKGVRAEQVAANIVKEVKEYLKSGVPVGKYLADQLLIPMALAGGGRFKTICLTDHSKTNMEILKKFLNVNYIITEIEKDIVEIEAKSD